MRTYDYDVYRDELRSLGLGLPVYEPNPCHYDHVRIGDVGVMTDIGYFERVFNIFYDADHPINARFGVPNGFVRGEDTWRVENGVSDLLGGAQLKSEHVQSVEISASAQIQSVFGADMSPGAAVKFRSAKRNGAVLHLPKGASGSVAMYKGQLRRYAEKHCRSWLHHIRSSGLDFQPHNVMFVDGYHLSEQWVTAVLRIRETESNARVGVHSPFLGGSFSVRVSEAQEFVVPLRIGPPAPQHNAAPVHQITLPLHNDTEEINQRFVMPKCNQCIFLRGYRVIERVLFPHKLEAAAEPEDLDMDRDGTSNPKILSTESDSDSEVDSGSNIKDKWLNVASELAFQMQEKKVYLIHEDVICEIAKRATQSEWQSADGIDIASLGITVLSQTENYNEPEEVGVVELNHKKGPLKLQTSVGNMANSSRLRLKRNLSSSQRATDTDYHNMHSAPLTLTQLASSAYPTRQDSGSHTLQPRQLSATPKDLSQPSSLLSSTMHHSGFKINSMIVPWAEYQSIKRGRGRPKGSENKPKIVVDVGDEAGPSKTRTEQSSSERIVCAEEEDRGEEAEEIVNDEPPQKRTRVGDLPKAT